MAGNFFSSQRWKPTDKHQNNAFLIVNPEERLGLSLIIFALAAMIEKFEFVEGK